MEKRVIHLLTEKEKVQYYELRLKMETKKDTISKTEHDKLYKEASKILLNAVQREIDRRDSSEKVIDLLTDKEKIQYYELRLKMETKKDAISKTEHDKLYKEASKILLEAVKREISRRESSN